MSRDASVTRMRLIRAAEGRFAREGVAGARLVDIVRDADQANDSAVGYHFGSRAGLLAAIVERHFSAMEERRILPPAAVDVAELVDLIVGPTADLLLSEEGRDFLRIMVQLTDDSGVGSGELNDILVGSTLGRQLDLLYERLLMEFAADAAREKVSLLVTFLAGALAERARSIEAGATQRMSPSRYVAHLCSVLTAAMSAPVGGP